MLFIEDESNKEGRWQPFESIKCSPETPCYLDQGDCDSDFDCYGALRCGVNNCLKEAPSPWNWWDDCCTSIYLFLLEIITDSLIGRNIPVVFTKNT